MKMRLSCFGFAKDIDAIAKAGFDCIEMHYRDIIPLDAGEFKAAKKKLNDSPMTAEVFNNPLPLDRQIIAEDFQIKDFIEHYKIGADRAADMGARFCNFGNGKTRSLLVDGTPSQMADARKKIVEAIKVCCDINAQYNITVLLEPLSPVVSNFILSIPEAIALAKELDAPNLKPFIDLRWFVDMQHPYSQILEYADAIQHIHIDCPVTPFPTRPIPRRTDDFDYAPFIDALKKICYKGIIACEANAYTDFDAELKELMGFFNSFDLYPYRA